MKIKKITPTNEYKHVDFGLLVNNWDGRYIYSPHGFQPILNFGYIKTAKPIILRIANGHIIECDAGHIVATNNGPKRAVDLDDKHDTLISYTGHVAFAKEFGNCDIDFYDITIPNPHWYYTSSIVSHNSLLLCNNAYTCIAQKLNVLFVTFELSAVKTAMRVLGSMSKEPLQSFHAKTDLDEESLNRIREKQQQVKNIAMRKYSGADLLIVELPPDECSVTDIYGIIDHYEKTMSWKPDVIILDYLDLMISKRASSNDKAYDRQKSVATEVRGLGMNKHALVFTATQTNRSGISQTSQNDQRQDNPKSAVINLDKAAESYGKAMPVDYVVSLNQTDTEYNAHPAIIRLYIAKNRNGPKFKSITTNVLYDRMMIHEPG